MNESMMFAEQTLLAQATRRDGAARRCGIVLSLAAAFTLTGCKPDSAVRDAATLRTGDRPGQGVNQPSGSNAAQVNPLNAGSIVGTVHFKGAAPKPVAIDMSMDPACAMADGANSSEQYVVNDGHLANVYVYIKAGAPLTSVTPDYAVTIDQKGCRFVPHVIALQQGGSVVFKNSDPAMHNVHIVTPTGSSPLDVSEAPGSGPQSQVFSTPQVMTEVRCNNHPWMNAFINVAPSPYFAVTGANGNFSIQGLPPGTYTLAAVQEKLGEQDMQVTVAPHTTQKADFSFAMK